MNDVVQKDYPKIIGIRRAALIELGLFFLIMMGIDILFLDGSRYAAINPHPFWIAVLLLSSQYGTAEGLLAAVVSSLCLWVGNLPDQTIDQDRYEYLFHIARNPLMWLAAAVIMGELRNKHIRERTNLVDSLEKSRVRETDIADSYNKLRGLKEGLELRIAGQFKSTVAAYRAAKSMERLHAVDVMHGVEQLVRAVMNPSKFSIFMLRNDKLELTVNSGWKEDESLYMTFESSSDIYQNIVGRQTVLCVSNNDHERVLAGQGLLAGPLLNPETNEVVGMLKIEDMNFLDLNLSGVETFGALCQWIGMAFGNAQQFEKAKSNSVINPEHNLYSFNYFRRHTDYITSLAKRIGFDVTMLMVKNTNAATFSNDIRRHLATMLGDAVKGTLRGVDLAFDYQTGGEEYAIVLPSTSMEGARVVMEKIQSSVNQNLVSRDIQAQFSYAVHVLHEHQRTIKSA